jgi:hypothetical protein
LTLILVIASSASSCVSAGSRSSSLLPLFLLRNIKVLHAIAPSANAPNNIGPFPSFIVMIILTLIVLGIDII